MAATRMVMGVLVGLSAALIKAETRPRVSGLRGMSYWLSQRSASKGNDMAIHHLDASPETVHWGYFDAGLKPLLTVESGDTVTFSTVSGQPTQVPKPGSGLAIPPALSAIHQKLQPQLGGPHILTGPVAV